MFDPTTVSFLALLSNSSVAVFGGPAFGPQSCQTYSYVPQGAAVTLHRDLFSGTTFALYQDALAGAIRLGVMQPSSSQPCKLNTAPLVSFPGVSKADALARMTTYMSWTKYFVMFYPTSIGCHAVRVNTTESPAQVFDVDVQDSPSWCQLPHTEEVNMF